jgi:hypothetical protein
MTEQDVRRLLANFVGDHIPTMLGKVTAVDKESNTCEIDDDGTAFYDIRLRPLTGENTGIVLYPKQGAYALCVQIEATDEYMVLHATQYEAISILCEDISFNEGKNDGLIKINELTAKLNALRTKFNSFVTAYNTHVHVTTATDPSDVVGVISAPAAKATQTAEFDKKDYENKKIKH